MAPIAIITSGFVPLITYTAPVHWSSSPTEQISENKSTSAHECVETRLTRYPSPQYYSEAHLSRDRELEVLFRAELRTLRKKHKEISWARLWELHKNFKAQFNQTFIDEANALQLTADKVIRVNIQERFSRLRHDIIKSYKTNKQEIPSKLEANARREEQQLRVKFYSLSQDLRKRAKSEFHLEIFDKILASQLPIETNCVDESSLTPSVERAAIPAQDTEAAAQDPTQEETASPERCIKGENQGEKDQPTKVLPVEDPVHSAASVHSKASAATKRSTSSAHLRSERGSTHSSIRLQETPLLTKNPVTTLPGTSGESGGSDPVPVKRNFWGKIIN